MNKELLISQQAWIRDELTRCADFWLTHGWDQENGGVYTCLDRWGNVYSTDDDYIGGIVGRAPNWNTICCINLGTVDGDDQAVSLAGGLLYELYMAYVQQVEAAVREDERPPFGVQPVALLAHCGRIENLAFEFVRVHNAGGCAPSAAGWAPRRGRGEN